MASLKSRVSPNCGTILERFTVFFLIHANSGVTLISGSGTIASLEYHLGAADRAKKAEEQKPAKEMAADSQNNPVAR